MHLYKTFLLRIIRNSIILLVQQHSQVQVVLTSKPQLNPNLSKKCEWNINPSEYLFFSVLLLGFNILFPKTKYLVLIQYISCSSFCCQLFISECIPRNLCIYLAAIPCEKEHIERNVRILGCKALYIKLKQFLSLNMDSNEMAQAVFQMIAYYIHHRLQPLLCCQWCGRSRE